MKPTHTDHTCSNCAHFCPHGDAGNSTPYCINLVTFYDSDGTHEPIEPEFCCEWHQTQAEHDADMALIEAKGAAK